MPRQLWIRFSALGLLAPREASCDNAAEVLLRLLRVMALSKASLFWKATPTRGPSKGIQEAALADDGTCSRRERSLAGFLIGGNYIYNRLTSLLKCRGEDNSRKRPCLIFFFFF